MAQVNDASETAAPIVQERVEFPTVPSASPSTAGPSGVPSRQEPSNAMPSQTATVPSERNDATRTEEVVAPSRTDDLRDGRKKKHKHGHDDTSTKGPNAAHVGETDVRDANYDTRDGDLPDSNGTLGRFRFLLQLRYRHSYVDEAQLNSQESLAHAQVGTVKEQDGYDIQRAFLRYTAQPSKYVNAKMLVDLPSYDTIIRTSHSS